MQFDEIETYELYLAIKLHFTSDYDFFQYRGKLPAKTVTFEKLLTKSYYKVMVALSKKYDSRDLCSYFVANALVFDGKYTFDLDAEGKRVFSEFVRRRDSRKYIFREDINRICLELKQQSSNNFWDCIEKSKRTQFPMLFNLYAGSIIAPETMCILLEMNNFLSKWDKICDDQFLYPVVSRQIKKLKPFIRIKDFSVFDDIIGEVAFDQLSGE